LLIIYSVMKWHDIEDIAIALEEEHKDKDNLNLRFTDLLHWVVSLKDFDDDPKKCNEKKLESIQMAWIEERQENNA